jgi:hypothetical protein
MSIHKAGDLNPCQPWPLPKREECFFYHSIDLPDEPPTVGDWDIRERFEQYIGHVTLRGKSVLDVGTAGGFLAFSSEQHGAAGVTALDVPSLYFQQRVPFLGTDYHADKRKWAADNDPGLVRSKRGFWYAWHKLKSTVMVCYSELDALLSTSSRWDIVIAGALIEHLADPIGALGAICRVADETVILPFTTVDFTPGEFMRPLIPWVPQHDYVWWVLSHDLYMNVLTGLGFRASFAPCLAVRIEDGVSRQEQRHTIVARRVHWC